MNDHFRDTVFGQAVRLLSRNRLLKFPDELDPILWKQCVQKDVTAASSTSEDHNGVSDYTAAVVNDSSRQGADTTTTHGSGDKRFLPQGDTNPERTTNSVLVEWYGPDDQEV
jgi:DHA1 family multidrug resistance protein-like MFS transporter